MITVTQSFKNNQSASVRNCIGRVEFYNGSTLYGAFTQADRIQSIEIQRSGDEAKLLGFYVSQRVNVKLLDINRTLSISSGMKMKVFIGYGNEMVSFPTFKVTEVNRDETTNQLSITGYDLLYSAVNGKYGNLGLGSKVSIKNVGDAIAKYINSTKAAAEWRNFDTRFYGGSYTNPFEATEELSKVITQLCEATASVAFLNNQDQLVFRGFSNTEAAVETIGKSRYFSLKSKENKRIGMFYSLIGENQINYKSTGQSGTTVYIRDNNFFKQFASNYLDQRLQQMIDYTGNYTMNQFEVETSGFLHLEFADRIALTLKNNSSAYSFIKSDTITFNGSIRHKIGFSFSNDQETATSPSTITEYLQRETNSRIDAIEKAAAEINGSKGGYVSILDTNGDGNPDNIFITDVEVTADDIVQYGNQYVLSDDTNATNVLRINKSGLGISTGFKAGTSRNGYQTAITGSGILADTITSGKLQSYDGKTYFDLDNSKIVTNNAEITGGSVSVQGDTYTTKLNDKGIQGFSTDGSKLIGTIRPLKEGDNYAYMIAANADNAEALYLGYQNSLGGYEGKMRIFHTGVETYVPFFMNNNSIRLGTKSDTYPQIYGTNNSVFLFTNSTVGCAVRENGMGYKPNNKVFLMFYGGLTSQGNTIYKPLSTDANCNLLYWGDNQVSTGSLEEYKKDINKTEISALPLINNSVIYDYKYKDEDDKNPTKYGLIIERECPTEIVDNSGDAINLYSMASLSWKAIQELSEKVEKLEARVKELEEKVGE